MEEEVRKIEKILEVASVLKRAEQETGRRARERYIERGRERFGGGGGGRQRDGQTWTKREIKKQKELERYNDRERVKKRLREIDRKRKK